MADQEVHRSLPDLLGSLAGDISGLFRSEIRLAKAEASEKLEDVVANSRGLAIGALLAIGAIGVFLAGVTAGLAAILVAIGMHPAVAGFVASMLVALAVGSTGWSMINASLAAWKASRLNLDKTGQSLARDAQVLKETF